MLRSIELVAWSCNDYKSDIVGVRFELSAC
jgi:hypothetical protein